jgi:hypothetical protein
MKHRRWCHKCGVHIDSHSWKRHVVNLDKLVSKQAAYKIRRRS